MHPAGKKTWIEISREALHSNINALSSLLHEDAHFCAVVKANAYGHGIAEVVRECVAAGISIFAVDSVEEGIEVRKAARDAEILVLGFTLPERLADVIKNDLVQTVYHMSTIEQLSEEATKLEKVAYVNLKIETGLNRQGIKASQLTQFLVTIRQNERSVSLYSLSSHFANAEDVYSPDFMKEQTSRLAEIAGSVYTSGFSPKYVHIACSAAAIVDPESQFNLARFGIAMYGCWSSVDLMRKNRISNRAIELKPVLSWRSRIAQIKDLVPGDKVGYGMTFTADRVMRIAVVPVGYYDGYARSIAGEGFVLVRGQKCRILGIICMNMFMIDVSNVPNASLESIVTLIGRDGMNEVKADDIADWTGTINYEVLARLNPAIPRIVV